MPFIPSPFHTEIPKEIKRIPHSPKGNIHLHFDNHFILSRHKNPSHLRRKICIQVNLFPEKPLLFNRFPVYPDTPLTQKCLRFHDKINRFLWFQPVRTEDFHAVLHLRSLKIKLFGTPKIFFLNHRIGKSPLFQLIYQRCCLHLRALSVRKNKLPEAKANCVWPFQLKFHIPFHLHGQTLMGRFQTATAFQPSRFICLQRQLPAPAMRISDLQPARVS